MVNNRSKSLILLLLLAIIVLQIHLISTQILKVKGVVPPSFFIGEIVEKDYSKNLIFIQTEYIQDYTRERWDKVSVLLNGTSPNADAMRELKNGDLVIGVVYGSIYEKQYIGWISIGKISNNKVTDIYGDINSFITILLNDYPLLGGFKIRYKSIPEKCGRCYCPTKYVVLSLYDKEGNLLLNKTMYPNDEIRYQNGDAYGVYINAYEVYIKFYNGTDELCIGPQGIHTFTIHLRELAVKFRGTVINASSQYDVIVKIDEILMDPEGTLSTGKYAHIDISEDVEETNVDWPLNKGDRVEVYAKHFCYQKDWIDLWIYSENNELDGYLKRIGKASLSAKIWVDKGCGSTYHIGDPVKIYFKVNSEAVVEIVDEFPNGSKKTLEGGYVAPNRTYSIVGRVGPPDGYRIFHIYAKDKYGNFIHEKCYINILETVKNKPPIAIIDEINPNPVYKGEIVHFKGHGYDPDGDWIVAYEWRSNIDGVISNEKEFTTDKLSIGTHVISFRVKDSRGTWSEPAIYQLAVKEPLIIFFSSEKIVIKKPYEVKFYITIYSGPSGNYKGEITVYAPNNRNYSQTIQIKYTGSVERYVIKWNIPVNVVPGTYVASLVIRDNKGLTISRKLCYFYLDDPDKSYIEVFKSRDNVKIIHVHLQRFRMVYGNTPIDPELLMYSFKLDYVGFAIRCLKDIYSLFSSATKGVVSPTKPYDLTVIIIPKEIYGHYIGLKYETHPLGILNEALKESTRESIETILKEALSKLGTNLHPSIPLPLEKLAIISKYDYDSFKVNTYTTLTIPTEIKVEYLTNIRLSYELGQTIGTYVKFINPRNNMPLKNVTIDCFVRPSEGNVTSSIIPSIYYCYLEDGIYRIEIPTEYIKNIYHAISYRIYFFGAAPGYIGISPAIPVMITDEQSFGDISNLQFSFSKKDISFSENLVIKLNFNTKIYLPNGRAEVKIKVVKKTFFGLMTKTIVEKEGIIGQNNIIIKLRGDQIADWFLWWPIAGKYDIKIIIVLTYSPYESATVGEINEETFYTTVSIHG